MKLPAALRLSPEWTPYVLLSPFVILFCVFGVFPLVFSLYLAFQSWEPTSGLDLLTRREFLSGLADLAAAGRTVLISSHSIAELEKACTHAGLLRERFGLARRPSRYARVEEAS